MTKNASNTASAGTTNQLSWLFFCSAHVSLFVGTRGRELNQISGSVALLPPNAKSN